MPTPPTFSTRRAGEVRSAQLLPFSLNHPRKKKPSAAQRLGLAYEKKVLAHLALELPDLQPHPAFKYNSRHSTLVEYAIPDGMLLDEKRRLISLFEVKLKHSSDAWHQLTYLYLPIVQAAFPTYRFNLIEVCKTFYPGVRLGTPSFHIEDLKKFVEEHQPFYGIFQWSGR